MKLRHVISVCLLLLALSLYEQDPQQAISLLTYFSNQAGHNTVRRWKELDNYLLVKYLDSNVKQEENGDYQVFLHHENYLRKSKIFFPYKCINEKKVVLLQSKTHSFRWEDKQLYLSTF